jgi:hypothetical protein
MPGACAAIPNMRERGPEALRGGELILSCIAVVGRKIGSQLASPGEWAIR